MMKEDFGSAVNKGIDISLNYQRESVNVGLVNFYHSSTENHSVAGGIS